MNYVRPVFNLYSYMKDKDEVYLYVVGVSKFRIQPRKWKYKVILMRTPTASFYVGKRTKIGKFFDRYFEKLEKRQFEVHIVKKVNQYKNTIYELDQIKFKV